MLSVSNINDGYDIYDIPSTAHRRSLEVKTHMENSALPILFIHDGNTILLGGNADGEAIVWDVDKGSVLGILEHSGLHQPF